MDDSIFEDSAMNLRVVVAGSNTRVVDASSNRVGLTTGVAISEERA